MADIYFGFRLLTGLLTVCAVLFAVMFLGAAALVYLLIIGIALLIAGVRRCPAKLNLKKQEVAWREHLNHEQEDRERFRPRPQGWR